jgi:hypothetical protein
MWTPTSKYLHLTTFSNICVIIFYPCSYICNCLKMPKKSQINEYSDLKYWRSLLSPCFVEIRRPAEQMIDVAASTPTATPSTGICEYELQSLPNLATSSTANDLYNLRLLASVCEEASNCAWQTDYNLEIMLRTYILNESNSSNFLWMHAEWARADDEKLHSYSATPN